MSFFFLPLLHSSQNEVLHLDLLFSDNDSAVFYHSPYTRSQWDLPEQILRISKNNAAKNMKLANNHNRKYRAFVQILRISIPKKL